MANSFSGDGGMDLKRFVATPAALGIVVIVVIVIGYEMFKKRSTTAAAGQAGVVANPSTGASQSSDAMSTLGSLQQQISTFEQDLATLGNQSLLQLPTVATPTPSPVPVPSSTSWHFGAATDKTQFWRWMPDIASKFGLVQGPQDMRNNPVNVGGQDYWNKGVPLAYSWQFGDVTTP